MSKDHKTTTLMFSTVRKRDGTLVPFDQSRITGAILKAMQASSEGDEREALRVADRTLKVLYKKFPSDHVLGIEEIQDAVEQELILMDFAKAAKAFILYRHERSELREKRREIPEHVKKLVAESRQYFRNALSEFVFYRSYSRWIEEEGRRETWVETVKRYMDYMRENLKNRLTDEEYNEIHQAILKQEVMPSMRLMWSAGKAGRATNASAYNCSFIAPAKTRDFAEIMYLSMCGTGVGFSVEQQNVQKLPQIKPQSGKKPALYVIEDSKEGWADALLAGLNAWFGGKDIVFDYSELRPLGARLKTMGGRSSGPGPLRELIDFTRRKILAKQGKRLHPIDVHDVICKIGEIVVSGGVRRTALLSLSDLDDFEMRSAKTGQFDLTEPQRRMANNSAVYSEKPASDVFLDEWIALAKSGTGERGIFNRGGLDKQSPARRWKLLKKHAATTGTNPCGEIILRSKEFCNLSEVVCRAGDTMESLLRKIRLATIIGTYQSTLTDFPYLSKEWKRNCDEERLLGVSLTGQWDCPLARDASNLLRLKEETLKINADYARRFGINPSVAVTCVKPSGTVSLLVDASSGMHPRHASHYIRRARVSATDSLFKMLKDQKVPFHPEVGQKLGDAMTYVFDFPVKAPAGAIRRNDVTALQQLEHWKMVKENYTEHNPSVTISVGDDEWIAVANWLYQNWEMLGGLSFLPREDHVYALAPYEEISDEVYKMLVEKFPVINFAEIMLYEKDDETEGAKEAACVGGTCEIQ